MPKIVILDGGFGGELFADYVESEIPTLEVIRVIDWRHADDYLSSRRSSRRAAFEALRPYIGTVDLIVFANFLLSFTSLSYFRHKFKNQKFTGFNLGLKQLKSPTLILTTTAVRHTIPFYNFAHSCQHPQILTCDSWPNLIDDGELSPAEIQSALAPSFDFPPRQIVLACTQFSDLRPVLNQLFGHKFTIDDGFSRALLDICHALKLRGYYHKNK